jgi:hypothetical protein
VKLRATPRPNVLSQARFTRLNPVCCESPAKQFVTQPNPVGVNNIRFAIVCNLADATLPIVLLDVCAADPTRFPR